MDKKTVAHIINYLRRGTLTWEVRRKALNACRKKVFDGQYFKNGKKKYKLFWQCPKCTQWFDKPSSLEVDHIVEIGAFNGDWDDYVRRMYCDVSNLQALCINCHSKKTSSNSRLRYERKNGL